MIELVPMAYRIVNTLDAASIDADFRAPSPNTSTKRDTLGSNSSASATKGGGKEVLKNGAKRMDEEEERDAVFFRLEMLGYRVGQGLVER